METAASKLFKYLNNYKKIEELIEEGEVENIILECKSPTEPKLNRGIKAQLSQAISGFSNTEGGIILWGVSTTKHQQGELDVLTQIEEIGNCTYFSKQIERSIPSLTTPSITNAKTKIVKKSKKNTKGIIITYIPKKISNPVQANDDKFYFRNGDEFTKLPYELLKRLFASTESPDLHSFFDQRLVKIKKDGIWEIPIILINDSSAMSEKTVMVIEIKNEDYCQSINCINFRDISEINPNLKIFSREITKPIHKGLNSLVGKIIVKMKKEKRLKRVLKINVKIYADRMIAREENISIYVSSFGITVKRGEERYLY